MTPPECLDLPKMEVFPITFFSLAARVSITRAANEPQDAFDGGTWSTVKCYFDDKT